MPIVSSPRQSASARATPAASDILCEGCGYTLNGLPQDSRCPECGKPIAESVGAGRSPTAWDVKPSPRAFVATSMVAIFRPTRFYRTLATRAPLRPAKSFAAIYWLISSILFAVAATAHGRWYFGFLGGSRFVSGAVFQITDEPSLRWLLGVAPVVFVFTFGTLYFTTHLAARLTTWEATYRGYRLPIDVVLRGLYYHAAHYLPVALLACATVVGFMAAIDRGLLGPQHLTTYLYVLSGEVVLGAGYLFSTYWTGMRNMMYANA